MTFFTIKWLKIAPWCLILAAAMPLTAQNVGIGTNAPAKKLDVQGAGGLKVNSTNNGTGDADWIAGNFGGTTGNRVVMGILQGNATIGAYDHTLNNWERLYLAPAGGLNIGSLTGPNTRMAVVNADGDLSVQAIPTIADGTVTNVSAAGTSGNPLAVTNGGTTPVVDMPAADATRNGYVSSTDWTTFNNKLTLPALTNGSLLFSNGAAIGEHNTKLFWDNPNGRLGVGGIRSGRASGLLHQSRFGCCGLDRREFRRYGRRPRRDGAFTGAGHHRGAQQYPECLDETAPCPGRCEHRFTGRNRQSHGGGRCQRRFIDAGHSDAQSRHRD
jgi:hypothetical protein